MHDVSTVTHSKPVDSFIFKYFIQEIANFCLMPIKNRSNVEKNGFCSCKRLKKKILPCKFFVLCYSQLIFFCLSHTLWWPERKSSRSFCISLAFHDFTVTFYQGKV